MLFGVLFGFREIDRGCCLEGLTAGCRGACSLGCCCRCCFGMLFGVPAMARALDSVWGAPRGLGGAGALLSGAYAGVIVNLPWAAQWSAQGGSVVLPGSLGWVSRPLGGRR